MVRLPRSRNYLLRRRGYNLAAADLISAWPALRQGTLPHATRSGAGQNSIDCVMTDPRQKSPPPCRTTGSVAWAPGRRGSDRYY